MARARWAGKTGKLLKRVRLVVALLLAVAIGYLWLRPVHSERLSANAHPLADYAEALQRFQQRDNPEPEPLAGAGKSLVFSHGRKTERVIVLLHGYTNCPKQFENLGQRFYALGYNVLIPRLPHHGLQNRMTEAQSHLTAEELAAAADDVVDVAHGLGNHVFVMGLSLGGVLTGWLAQHRADIDRAVLISPAFGYQAVPAGLSRPVMNLYLTLPNSYNWWDDTLQDKLKPDYVYPRWSTQALAQLLRLSQATQEQAAQHGPAAHAVWIVTNAHDADVDNHVTADLAANWLRQSPNRVKTMEFPATLKLDHDLIDPQNPHQNIAQVYPKLIALLQSD